MEIKHVQNRYFQTMIEIKYIRSKNKSGTNLSIKNHLEAILTCDEADFPTIQEGNQKHSKVHHSYFYRRRVGSVFLRVCITGTSRK